MINNYVYVRKLTKLDRLLKEKYNQFQLYKRIYESNNKKKAKDEIEINDPEIIELLDLSSVDLIDILKNNNCEFEYMALPDNAKGQTLTITNYNELINAIHTLIEFLRQ